VGAKFSPPVQNGPGTHRTPCAVGTGSFSGLKRPERVVCDQETSYARRQ